MNATRRRVVGSVGTGAPGGRRHGHPRDRRRPRRTRSSAVRSPRPGRSGRPPRPPRPGYTPRNRAFGRSEIAAVPFHSGGDPCFAAVCHAGELFDALAEFGGGQAGAHPARADPGGAAQRGVGVAADGDRHRARRPRLEVPAAGAAAGAEQLGEQVEDLVGPPAAGPEVRADLGELRLVPARADTEVEPLAGRAGRASRPAWPARTAPAAARPAPTSRAGSGPVRAAMWASVTSGS